MISGHFFNGIVNEGQTIIESVDTPCLRKGVRRSKVEMQHSIAFSADIR